MLTTKRAIVFFSCNSSFTPLDKIDYFLEKVFCKLYHVFKMKKNLFISILESFFLANWWTIASVLLFFGIYESASYRTLQTKMQLIEKIHFLEEQIIATKEKNALFYKELGSISDPAWIEMQLIHKLGLVRKGQKKALLRYKE